MTHLKRPILRWHGGKWMLAPWIISHFPAHQVYVEPFGGAASVLLRKHRARAEVYNDLDASVVNLFRVLQDAEQSMRLREILAVTPYARREFELAYIEVNDAVEAARRLIIRSFMGFGSNAHACIGQGANSTGFRSNSNRSGGPPARDWANYPEALAAIIERLMGVTIESRDASAVMKQHDGVQVLHYVDPPYVAETRAITRAGGGMRGMYRHELNEEGHAALLNCLKSLRGMVVLSGYPHRSYEDALSDWRRVERAAFADGARSRVEVLWLNPACAAALDQEWWSKLHEAPLYDEVPA